jgi:signal transduction histidine kinase
MKLLIIAFLFTIFLFTTCFGQQRSLDSLAILLSNQNTDAARIDIMLFMATLYQDINPVKTLDIAQEIIVLSKKIGDKQREALGINRLGIGHWALGNLDKALLCFQQSDMMANALKNENILARNATNIGLIYGTIGNNRLALSQHQKALKIFTKLQIHDRIVTTSSNICDIYGKMGKYDSAKITTIRTIYLAERYYPVFLPRLYLYLSEFSIVKKQYINANIQLKKALFFANKFDNQRIRSTAHRLLAAVALEQNQLDTAQAHALYALELAKKTNMKEQLQQGYEVLSKVFFAKKEYKKAYEYKTLFVIYRDSLQGETIEKSLQLFDYERKKGELAILRQEIFLKEKANQEQTNRQRWILFSAIGSLVFVSMIAWQMYLSRKKIKTAYQKLEKVTLEVEEQKNRVLKTTEELLKSNQDLSAQQIEVQKLNEHLENIVAERTAELGLTVQRLIKQNQDLEQFSYIVSHNLRAPVARVLGLVHIFNQENMEDVFNKEILSYIKQSTEDLDEVIRDLTNMVLIRKSITESKDMVDIEEVMAYELVNLGEEIRKTEANIIQNLNIREVYTIKPYMQSIVHNLLSNALKYKHPNREPEIYIQTELYKGAFRLIVKDNGLGVGIEDPYKIFGLYQRMHTHVEGKGLGLYLVKTQIEAMNGTIEVQSEVEKGTTFIVILPSK